MNPKDLLNNLQQNAPTMSDGDFNSALTQLAGQIPADKQQAFGQATDQIRKMRTAFQGNQAASNIDKNFASLSDSEYQDQLSKATAGAQALGVDPGVIKQNASDLTNKRLSGNANGQKSGILQSAVSGVANIFQKVGLDAGAAIAGYGGKALDSVGGFLQKYAPSASGLKGAGAAMQSAGQFAEQKVQQAQEGGIDTGYTGILAPAGSSAADSARAGAMSKNEALARGATEALGDFITAGSTAAGGLVASAAGMGLGTALTGVGKGEKTSQAVTEGATTATLGLVFGGAAHVLAGWAGGAVNKVIRSQVGGQLMQGVQNLGDRMKALVQGGAEATPEGQAALEGVGEKLNIAKAGLNATMSEAMAKPDNFDFNDFTDEIRQGSADQYNDKRALYDQVFNNKTSLSSDELANTAETLDSETGGIGIKQGQDLVNKFKQAQGESAAQFGSQTDPALEAKLTAARAGISPEDMQTVKNQLDQAPEDPASRNGFTSWVTRLRGLVTRPEGATTATLQSYLNPPQFKGKYDAIATRISEALRSDLEGKFQETGQYDTYKAADAAQKKIAENVTTSLRQTAFDASSKEEFVRRVVDGEVKPNDPAIKGFTRMLDPQTKGDMQNALVNEIKRQVDEQVHGASNPDELQSAYQAGAKIIDGFVKNYSNTDFLTPSDKTDLLTWSSLLKRDLSSPEGYTQPVGAGPLADKVQGKTAEAQATGKQVNAGKGVLEGLQQGDPTLTAKAYEKLTDTQKSAMFSSMPDDLSRKSLGSVIVGEKLKASASNFADKVSELGTGMTKEDASEALSESMKTYENIMADKELWNNGLTSEQKTTISDAVKTYETLKSLEGNKAKEAIKQLASAPILTALGHPMAAVMELLRGSKGVVESLIANTGDMSKTQAKMYDDIMSSAGKDSILYKTLSSIREFMANPLTERAVKKAGTIAGKGVSQIQQVKDTATSIVQ
jgi:hypothetical protein